MDRQAKDGWSALMFASLNDHAETVGSPGGEGSLGRSTDGRWVVCTNAS